MVQLPAVNTPQFDWARSRLPRRLQPVPPIFEPRSVAEEIYRAAMEAPREFWIGRPTMQALLGQLVAPGLLDRLAAEQAWDGQMTAEQAAPRPDNLFEPVVGDQGTEGRFGQRTQSGPIAASASTVRGATAMIGAGLVGAAAAGVSLAARVLADPRTRRRPRRVTRG
jgi:hypothetical protein